MKATFPTKTTWGDEQTVDLARQSVITLASMDVLTPHGEQRKPAVDPKPNNHACRKPAQTRRRAAVRRNAAQRVTRAVCRKEPNP